MENLKYYLDYYFGSNFANQRNIHYESMFTNYGVEKGTIAVNKDEFERLCSVEEVIKIDDKVLIYNGLIIHVTETNNSNCFNSFLTPTESVAKIIAYFKNVEFNNEYLNEFKIESALIVNDLIKKLKLRIFENKKRDLADQVRNITGSINRSKEQLSNYFNQLRMAQATSFEGYLEKASANLDNELELIKKHKKVESITVEGDRMVVNTVHLYITETTSNRRFSLGKMSIKMPLTTGMNIIFINNTTTRYGYWSNANHPHVANDGNPCLGNIEMGVVNYITEEQYYGLFLLLLNYLECVDVEDCAGCKILAWDEVNENNEVIKEGIPRASWEGKIKNVMPDIEINPFGTTTPRRIPEDNECECVDCHRIITLDDSYYCERCEARICDECVIQHGDQCLCSECYSEVANEDYEEEPDDF